MKRIECVAYEFAPGEEVPSWMIDVEPSNASAHRGRITFVDPVVVVQRPDESWVVVGARHSATKIHFGDGMHDVAVFAPGENIDIVTGFTRFDGRAPASALTEEWKP